MSAEPLRSTGWKNRAGRLSLVALCLWTASCATLEGLRVVPDLKVQLEDVVDVHLAGVAVDRVRSYKDLSPVDALRIANGLIQGELPLDMNVLLSARNESSSAARIDLLTFDWTLFLDRVETVSGVYSHDRSIEPGSTDDIEIALALDLAKFFDNDAKALYELAARAAGLGGDEPEVGLRLRPTFDTPVGPVRYPRDILVGSGSDALEERSHQLPVNVGQTALERSPSRRSEPQAQSIHSREPRPTRPSSRNAALSLTGGAVALSSHEKVTYWPQRHITNGRRPARSSSRRNL